MSANGMLVDEELKDLEDQKLISDELLDTTVFFQTLQALD
jgi:hypothetical protein